MFLPRNSAVLLLALTSLALHSPRATAENWPGFRGPTGQGISSEKILPENWSKTDGVAWRVPVPGEGWSSPIVFGDQVFLTAASEEGRRCQVLAFDRTSGRPLWTTAVFEQELRRKEGKNSYATPTPVTDGERVYAVFGGGGIAAVNVDGSIAWTNVEKKFYSQHGLGASPRLVGDLLVMPFDGSSDGDNKQVGWKIPWEQAELVALDKRTGQRRWIGKRGPSRIAHVTPLLAESQGKSLLLSGAGDVIQGFDPRNGERLWSAYSQGEGVVPSLVLGDDGIVYSVSGFEDPTIRAVRIDGSGDVTKSHIVWEQKTGVPNQASPIYVKPHLFTVTDNGIVSCLDAKDGKILARKRIGGNFSASPIAANGKLYFLDENATCTILSADEKLQDISVNSIGEPCQASPAASQGCLFIRTAKALYCIGPKD